MPEELRGAVLAEKKVTKFAVENIKLADETEVGVLKSLRARELSCIKGTLVLFAPIPWSFQTQFPNMVRVRLGL